MMLSRTALLLLALAAPALMPAAHAQAPGVASSAAPGVPPIVTKAAPGPAKATPAMPAAGGLIDINSASVDALDTLPGIGAPRAKAIIAGRPYGEKSELLSRKIIPADVYAKLAGQIALANVNTASAADMAKVLPNVGPVRAEAIVKNRPYTTMTELVSKGAVTQSVFESIHPLITLK